MSIETNNRNARQKSGRGYYLRPAHVIARQTAKVSPAHNNALTPLHRRVMSLRPPVGLYSFSALSAKKHAASLRRDGKESPDQQTLSTQGSSTDRAERLNAAVAAILDRLWPEERELPERSGMNPRRRGAARFYLVLFLAILTLTAASLFKLHHDGPARRPVAAPPDVDPRYWNSEHGFITAHLPPPSSTQPVTGGRR